MANKETKRLGNKGFSLVELIVVIAIMAVLVGVLAPQFIRYVEKSRQSGDVTSIQQLMTAIETSASEEGKITGDVEIKIKSIKKDGKDVLQAEASGTGVSDALKESGLGTSVNLKSSGWNTNVVIKYTIADYKWGISGTTENKNKPKIDLKTLVQTTSSGTGTGAETE